MILSLHGRFSGMIGNILGHYDTALFGLLAPFIAPLFFDESDPLTALILTYAIMPLGLLSKPFGALVFGRIGDRCGRKKALCCSLLCMGIVTFLMGCLPIYKQVGSLAPILLAIGRMLQSFCAAGESTSGSIFVLENSPLNQKNMMSSFYDVSSLSGPLLASGLVTLLTMQEAVEEWWRFLFILGGITAIFGLFLRLSIPVKNAPLQQAKVAGFLEITKLHKGVLLSIIITSGFSYITYAMPFILMNGYVPLVTKLARSDVMKVNTLLIACDMLLLPCFGFLAHRFGKERLMLTGAFCSAISAIPLFYCLDGAGIFTVCFVRLAIIIFGVAFAAPYHAWKLEQVPPRHYSVLSFGYALGSQLIGAPTSAICLWLYQQFGYIWSPGLYLLLFGSLAWFVVYKHSRAKAKLEVIALKAYA